MEVFLQHIYKYKWKSCCDPLQKGRAHDGCVKVDQKKHVKTGTEEHQNAETTQA